MDKKKALIMVLASTAMMCWASGALALENDYATMALWHMDEIVVIDDANCVDDDDAIGVNEMRYRNRYLEVPGCTLVTPGYNGRGKALDFADPNGIDDPNGPVVNGSWAYRHSTFRFQGWISTDDANDRYIFCTQGQQIVIKQSDADSDGESEIVFSVKTYQDGNGTGPQETHTLYAEMVDGNDWQYVECSYELDVNVLGTMSIITDVQSVEAVQGVGGIASQVGGNPYIYLGSDDEHTSSTVFRGRMDEVKLSWIAVPVPRSRMVEDGPRTFAVWHMDEYNDAGYVPDDNSFPQIGPERHNDLRGNIVAPGFDGTGKCLWLYPDNVSSAAVTTPYPWRYEWESFKFEGWVASDFPDSARAIVSLRKWQVQLTHIGGYFRLLATTNIDGNEVLSYVRAEMVHSTDWQHVTASYEIDQENNGVMTVESDVETVVEAKGQGPILGYSFRNIYIGRLYKEYGAGYHWTGRMDEVKISYPPRLGCGRWDYYEGDFNHDCYVDMNDVTELGENWLVSTDPADEDWQLGLCDSYINYNIPFTSSPPTIDGIVSAGEWTDAKVVDLAWPEIETLPRYGAVSYQKPTHEDCSSLWYFKWDNTYLYLAAVITDQKFYVWYGDPYEYSPRYDHLRWGFNLYNDGNNAIGGNAVLYALWRDYNGVTDVVEGGAMPATNALKASSVTADGYSIEVAFKWSDFNGYSPILNDVHGAVIRIGDSDDINGIGSALGSWVDDSIDAFWPEIDLSKWHTITLVNNLSCGDHGYLRTDPTRDCVTTLPDFGVMAGDWMKCTDPDGVGCDDLSGG